MKTISIEIDGDVFDLAFNIADVDGSVENIKLIDENGIEHDLNEYEDDVRHVVREECERAATDEITALMYLDEECA